MISKTLFAYFLLFAIAFCNPAVVAAQGTTDNYAALKTGILKLVNKHRTDMGLSPLKMNDVIEKAATKHSGNMASQKIPFGHEGFDERMKGISQQLGGATGWAENVAMGAETAEQAVDMWLHSAGHKKNIEGDYNLTGIGIAKNAQGQLYYTQIFIKAAR
jgi:uncharacterized protein YkwD